MANEHERGQVIRLFTDPPFRNDSGVETDPTTVTVRVTDPLGATTDYTLAGGQVVKTIIGQGFARSQAYPNGDFYYDLATSSVSDSQCGYWVYTWIGTGTVATAQKNTFKLLNEKTR